jgi:hypothetical protein
MEMVSVGVALPVAGFGTIAVAESKVATLGAASVPGSGRGRILDGEAPSSFAEMLAANTSATARTVDGKTPSFAATFKANPAPTANLEETPVPQLVKASSAETPRQRSAEEAIDAGAKDAPASTLVPVPASASAGTVQVEEIEAPALAAKQTEDPTKPSSSEETRASRPAWMRLGNAADSFNAREIETPAAASTAPVVSGGGKASADAPMAARTLELSSIGLKTTYAPDLDSASIGAVPIQIPQPVVAPTTARTQPTDGGEVKAAAFVKSKTASPIETVTAVQSAAPAPALAPAPAVATAAAAAVQTMADVQPVGAVQVNIAAFAERKTVSPIEAVAASVSEVAPVAARPTLNTSKPANAAENDSTKIAAWTEGRNAPPQIAASAGPKAAPVPVKIKTTTTLSASNAVDAGSAPASLQGNLSPQTAAQVVADGQPRPVVAIPSEAASAVVAAPAAMPDARPVADATGPVDHEKASYATAAALPIALPSAGAAVLNATVKVTVPQAIHGKQEMKTAAIASSGTETAAPVAYAVPSAAPEQVATITAATISVAPAAATVHAPLPVATKTPVPVGKAALPAAANTAVAGKTVAAPPVELAPDQAKAAAPEPVTGEPGHASVPQFASAVQTAVAASSPTHAEGALGTPVSVSAVTAQAPNAMTPVASQGASGSPVPHASAANVPALEGDPRTLVATPNVLEVGVASGTHGWLRVRAEMNDGGTVAASVTATSEAGMETLHKEVPGISAYLAGESIGVSSLVVSHAGASAGVGDATTGLGSGNSGAEGGRRDGPGGSQASNADVAEDAPGLSSLAGMGLEFGGAGLPEAGYATGSGGWLNVHA